MHNEESEGVRELMVENEEEVDGPSDVGKFKEEPAKLRIDIDGSEGMAKPAVIELDAGQYKPAE